jgi:hypothetical protein
LRSLALQAILTTIIANYCHNPNPNNVVAECRMSLPTKFLRADKMHSTMVTSHSRSSSFHQGWVRVLTTPYHWMEYCHPLHLFSHHFICTLHLHNIANTKPPFSFTIKTSIKFWINTLLSQQPLVIIVWMYQEMIVWLRKLLNVVMD